MTDDPKNPPAPNSPKQTNKEEKVIDLFRRRGEGGTKQGSSTEQERYLKKLRQRAELSSQEAKDKPMTLEETMFVQAMAEGCSLSQAYRRAYPLDEVDKSTAYDRGRTISLRVNVASAIVDLVDTNRMWEEHTGKRLRLFIARQLEDIAASSPNDAARISALEKLGKLDHVRAFEERKATQETPVDPKQIIQEIEKRLSNMKEK